MRSIFTVEVLIAIVAFSGGAVSAWATYRSVIGERKARSAKLKKAEKQQPNLTSELHVESNGDELRRHLREAIGEFTIRDYASDSDVSSKVDSVLDKLEASAAKRKMEGQQQKPMEGLRGRTLAEALKMMHRFFSRQSPP